MLFRPNVSAAPCQTSIMVRLRIRCGAIPFDRVHAPSPLKPVKDPRAPQDGKFSNRQSYMEPRARESTPRTFIAFAKFTKAPQASMFSNLSRSLNGLGVDADNQQWPPLGWSMEHGQDDRFPAPLTDRGLPGCLQRMEMGTGFIIRPSGKRVKNERAVGSATGRCPGHQPIPDHQWKSLLTQSIETSTDDLTHHRGHRDDQCGSSCCPECLGPTIPQ